MWMFQLDDVKVTFGRKLALSTDRVEFTAGTTVALMGPNGAGKTTLLSVLAGLLSPTSGKITGTSAGTHTGTSSKLVPVGYVAQEARQLVSLTAGEIITMGRYRARGLLGRLRKSDRAMLAEIAVKLGVADLLAKQFGTLSGGQRQRVRVAAALANDAECLLLDEPITGLDLPSQEIIFEVINAERSKRRLVMMSTHNIDEARRCDRVVLLNTTLMADGSPTEVLTEPNLRAAFGEKLVSVVPQAPALALLDGHGHSHLHSHSHDLGPNHDIGIAYVEATPKQASV